MLNTEALRERLFKQLSQMLGRFKAEIDKLASSNKSYDANKDNELSNVYMDLTTSDKYYLPFANSVPAGTRRVLRLPDAFATTVIPRIAVKTGDAISYSGGTETELVLDQGRAVEVLLTSDGDKTWRL